MNFEKGLLLIIGNLVKGVALIFPLLFEGAARYLMCLILLLFFIKGMYDLQREIKGRVSAILLWFVSVTGIISGFSISLLFVMIWYDILFELKQLSGYLLLISSICLLGSISLTYIISLRQQEINS
ncbi:MAG: hypothetical protein LLG02_08510 [Pelosinus sp.]|nr:hypothetical protein [Pelosinus sp.]